MNTQDEAKKYFLLGTIVVTVLILAGIVWAIMAGPSDPSNTSAPTETNLQFSDVDDPSIGPADSKYIIRVFGDFQCPACRSAEIPFKAITKKYADRLRIIWNDFPLRGTHPNALSAAVAARCAEGQGKFWEFHDKLYDKQAQWSGLSDPTTNYKEYANELQLNAEQFSTCIENKTYLSKITNDESEGANNRVQATPTFFVGNRRLEGVISEAQWEQAIQTLFATP